MFSNVVVQFLWPCCVLFPLFDSRLSPMAYSLTFNLLALLCTSPSGRAPCGLLPVLCLLFRFVLQGLIIKTSFLDILSVFWKVREGYGLSLVSGAEALSPLFGKGVELLRHFHVNAQPLCSGSSGVRRSCPGHLPYGRAS